MNNWSTRRKFVASASTFAITVLAGCSGESDVQDSDSDGMIDSKDYAPNDPDVQKKSDLSSNEETSQPESTPTEESTPTSEQSTDASIGQVDVDIQTDSDQNNIGYDVETYFEDSATLTVTVTDGEATAQRSFEGTTTTGGEEFNDDIEPPNTFKDNEEYRITFTLSVDGELADEKAFTGTYSE